MEKESKIEVPVHPIFGIPIFVGSKGQLLAILASQIQKSKGIMVVFTPNPEQISFSFHDPQFLQELKQGDLNLPDGQGIVWALKKQGIIIQRIPGREIFHDLMVLAKDKGWKTFLLGGRPGSASLVADKFGVSYDPGARDIQQETLEEENRVLDKIRKAKPKILFIAYGAPWQEHWILRHKAELERAEVKLAMVVGGAFDYEAGFVSRVPEVFEKLRLEWLWRLLTQPWRWKRQLKGLEFFWRVISTI